ncbi:carbohydrate ABC transporter permease [Actinomadura viridis]|uniref:carbohydrate ABC transporter permease n=1 Tax=Actinomadura viridis TaxID=58110 RepID=UPI003674D39B
MVLSSGTRGVAAGAGRPAASPAAGRAGGRKVRRVVDGYALVLPAALLYGVFLLAPIVQTVYLGFTRWDGLTASPAWTGLDNYRRLVGDERFFSALLNNLRWVAGSWLAQGFGLALAALLSASWIRGRTVFRTVFFVPATMSLVVVGIVWDFVYNPNWGLLNGALETVGAGAATTGWLSGESTAMPAVIATANWTYFGFAMVIFMAGLQNVDRSLYEAAALDGAGALAQFRHITVPGLRTQITLLLIVSFINTLRTFDLVYVMTSGGPGGSTEVVAYYIYSLAFTTRQVGYGAATAVVLTVLTLLITIVFLRLRERD